MVILNITGAKWKVSMTTSKQDFFSKYDNTMNKLFGSDVSNVVAKSKASELEFVLLTGEPNIDEVIALARAYEIGTYKSNDVVNPDDSEKNYYNNSYSVSNSTEDYGLSQNFKKSMELLKKVVEQPTIEQDLKENIDNKIKELTSKQDQQFYQKSTKDLIAVYLDYQKHLFSEIEKKGVKFTEDFDVDKAITAIPLNETSEVDSGLEKLIEKYNATLKILTTLTTKPDSPTPYKDIIGNYKALHNAANVGGLIKEDRSLGEKFFNEAARILLSIVTLGYKNDFVLLKSQGKTKSDEAEKIIDKAPTPSR